MAVEGGQLPIGIHRPELDALVLAARDDPLAIGAEGHAADEALVPGIPADLDAGGAIPEPDGPVPAPRGEIPPVGAVSHRVDEVFMSPQGADRLTGLEIPDIHPSGTRHGDLLAVGADGHEREVPSVSGERIAHLIPRRHIQHLDITGIAAASRDNPPAVGGEGQAVDYVGSGGFVEAFPAGGGIQQDEVRAMARGQPSTVRAVCDGVDTSRDPAMGEGFRAGGHVAHHQIARLPALEGTGAGRNPTAVRAEGHREDDRGRLAESLQVQMTLAAHVGPFPAAEVRRAALEQLEGAGDIVVQALAIGEVDPTDVVLPPQGLRFIGGDLRLLLGLGTASASVRAASWAFCAFTRATVALFSARAQSRAIPVNPTTSATISAADSPAITGRRRAHLTTRSEPRHRPRHDRLAVQVTTQVLRQRRRRGIPPRRILLQALQADRLQVARDRRIQPPRRHRLVVDDLEHGVHRRWPPGTAAGR